MTHKIEGTTVNAVQVDCALQDGHTGSCRPVFLWESMVVIVLSQTRARMLRAFLNRYVWREHNRTGLVSDRERAAEYVLEQIRVQLGAAET